MVHIYDGNLTDIIKLFWNVGASQPAPAGLEIWPSWFIAVRLATQASIPQQKKIDECCYWMQRRMTNCLMAWRNDPTRLHSLCNRQEHVTITVTTWDTQDMLKNSGFHGPGLRLFPLLLWILMLCRVRPCRGRTASVRVSSLSSSQPPSRCNIYSSPCVYRLFYCEEVSPVRFVTLLFMQAGDFMQSINCPPHPIS